MKKDNKKLLRSYTIYLIKDNIQELDKIIIKERIDIEHELKIDKNKIGTLYLKKPNYKIPTWANMFNKYIDINDIGRGGNPSALLLLNVKGKIFAITFGQGRYLLNQDCWEERFGLKVSLNTIAEKRIKSLDKKSFDSISLLTREQASKEIGAEEFGLDIEKDLLRAVVGFPKNPEYGERISGMDSLKTAIRLEVNEINELCEKYLDKFNDNSYKNNFPWVDHLTEIKDNNKMAKLDEELVDYIKEEKFDLCWTSVPEIIDWSLIEGFKYGFNSRSPIHYDITLSEFLNERLDGTELSIEKIKNRYVYGVSEDHNVVYKWSIYKCIYCEVNIEQENFLLSGGKWYKIDNSFVDEVNNYYNSLKKCVLDFPDYNHDSETEYNTFLSSQSENFILMDRKLINIRGRNKIEFCDIYESGGYLIHIKRYGASSVLSHLFMQGMNSGELFQTDKEFRNEVNELLPEQYQFIDVGKRPEFNKYEVVYAIISGSDGESLGLPFFSKLTLRNATKRLEGLGFRVSIKKILVNRNKKLFKKLPAKDNY